MQARDAARTVCREGDIRAVPAPAGPANPLVAARHPDRRPMLLQPLVCAITLAKFPPIPDQPDMDAKTTEHAAHHHPRVEDDPLVRGLGRFADDVMQPGQAYAFFLRSPHASARIVSIDAGAAQAMPGVLAVLTGADMQAAGIT